MATVRPLNQPRSWDSPSYGAAKPAVEENEHEQQPIEIKIGKMMQNDFLRDRRAGLMVLLLV